MEKKNKRINGSDIESKLERFRLFGGLLRHYFTGKESEKEKQIIDRWDAQSTWEKYREKVSNHNMDAACGEVWDRINSQLNLDKTSKTFRLRPFVLRYAAAIAFIILLGGGAFYLNQIGTFSRLDSAAMAQVNVFFETTNTQIKQITLPDGSKIKLNRGTRFSYAQNTFNREQREVWLIGEAFFEVAKNPDKPFIIHTGNMQTTVRGTSFNIKAYPDLKENVVSVLTGKVEVSAQNKVLAMLTPDEQLDYNTATAISQVTCVDAREVAGWQDGALVLNYAGRNELSLRIKQQYNIDTYFRNNALNGIRIKSTFVKGTSLTDVLATIEVLYGVKCKKENNQLIIDIK